MSASRPATFGAIASRALVFAFTVLVASFAVDLLLWVWQAGALPARVRGYVVFRGALHGATFVLALLGGAAGLAAGRGAALPLARVALPGLLLGIVNMPALLNAYRIGGFRAMAAWLLLASLLAAWAGAWLLRPRPRTPAG